MLVVNSRWHLDSTLSLYRHHMREHDLSPSSPISHGTTSSMTKNANCKMGASKLTGCVCAEAFAEMLYLFQRPSVLGDMDSIHRHCVLVVQSEPSKILTPWPYLDELQPVSSSTDLFISSSTQSTVIVPALLTHISKMGAHQNAHNVKKHSCALFCVGLWRAGQL